VTDETLDVDHHRSGRNRGIGNYLRDIPVSIYLSQILFLAPLSYSQECGAVSWQAIAEVK
jgi:hypothetical protein